MLRAIDLFGSSTRFFADPPSDEVQARAALGQLIGAQSEGIGDAEMVEVLAALLGLFHLATADMDPTVIDQFLETAHQRTLDKETD